MNKTCEKNCECSACTDFISSSSMYGLRMNEFIHLDEDTKEKILRIMARIMERAYRRGVQQASTLYENGHMSASELVNLAEWRYEKDLDYSFGIDGFKTSSLWRLNCEESLREVGLYCEDDNKWI